jgi:hypothetical protein
MILVRIKYLRPAMLVKIKGNRLPNKVIWQCFSRTANYYRVVRMRSPIHSTALDCVTAIHPDRLNIPSQDGALKK